MTLLLESLSLLDLMKYLSNSVTQFVLSLVLTLPIFLYLISAYHSDLCEECNFNHLADSPMEIPWTHSYQIV